MVLGDGFCKGLSAVWKLPFRGICTLQIPDMGAASSPLSASWGGGPGGQITRVGIMPPPMGECRATPE